MGAGLGFAIIEFLVAIVIAAILFVTGEAAVQVLRRFVARIGGAHHLGLLDVAAQTIRGVAAGVIFTAFIQAVLLALGLLVVGAPGPVLLSFLTFFLLVIQLPNWLVWLPVVAWLGYKGSTGYAIFLFVWGTFVVSTVDNFIRPYLISQGAKLPLLLIFVGVIGGLFGLRLHRPVRRRHPAGRGLHDIPQLAGRGTAAARGRDLSGPAWSRPAGVLERTRIGMAGR